MFDFSEEQLSALGMDFGLSGFMLFMLFIIWDLAKQSRAGKRGTAVLFFVLGTGMIGFVAKTLIRFLWKI